MGHKVTILVALTLLRTSNHRELQVMTISLSFLFDLLKTSLGGTYEEDPVPSFEQLSGKQISLMKKIELLFHTKTHFCKHKSPDCITNAFQGLISNFKIGVKIRLAVTLI